MSPTKRPRPMSSESHVTKTEADVELPALENETSNRKTQPMTPSPWHDRAIYAACIVIHVLLVAAHAILVAVGNDGEPVHFVKDSVWSTGLFFVVVNAPNVIGKTILVIVLYMTQKLALRRNLHVPQSLTSVHDKSTAWLGLGPALVSVWKQISVTKGEKLARKQALEKGEEYQPKHDVERVIAVVAILAYLAGLFVLGLTMPLLLDVGFVYDYGQLFENITMYLPTVGNDPVALQNDFPIVSIVPLLDWDIVTYGFQFNYVFDIPNYSTGDQPITVSAVGIFAACHALPQSRFIGYNNNNGTFTFEVSPLIERFDLVPAPRSLSVVPLKLIDPSQPAPATMIVASTLPVLDDVASTQESIVDFTPSILSTNCTQTEACMIASQIQFVACDFSTQKVSGKFDPVTISLVEVVIDDELVPWTDWSIPGAPVDSTLNLVHNFSLLSPESGRSQAYQVEGGVAWTRNLSLIDNELMDALEYDLPSVPNVTLDPLEHALQRVVGSVLWRAALTKAHDAPEPRLNNPTRYVLKISSYPPILGLVISSVLLVIAAPLCWQPPPKSKLHSQLETPGVLQLTYLSAVQSSVPQGLYAALDGQSPHLDTLRAAGKKSHAWSFGIPVSERPSEHHD